MRLALSKALAIVVLIGPSAASAAPPCARDLDCPGDELCVAATCVPALPAPPPSSPGVALEQEPAAEWRPASGADKGPRPRSIWRNASFGVYYLALPPVAGDLQSAEVMQSVGLEITVRLPGEWRWTLAQGFQAATKDALVMGGIRSDWATFGYVITVLDRGRWQIGIEPALRVLASELYVVPDYGAWNVFLSGFSASAIVGMGKRGYLRVEPVGADLRWIFFGNAVDPVTGVGLEWRFRVAFGVLVGDVK